MLLILSTSLIPMDHEIEGFGMIMEITPFVQNLLHAPVFALLSILWVQIMNVHQIKNRRKYILVFIIGVGFGLLNELIQGVVPGRYPSILDMGINVSTSYESILYAFVYLVYSIFILVISASHFIKTQFR